MGKLTLFETLIRTALPVDCLCCGAEGEWLCQACQKQLGRASTERCVICKKAGSNGLCPSCRIETGLDGAIALFSYQQPAVRGLVEQLKYQGAHSIARWLMRKYRTSLRRVLPEEGVVTYIPQTKNRARERGYNQAELLARELAGEERIWSGLVKARETSSQVGLSKRRRRQNVRGAFLCRTDAPKSIIIVDDVITTGSTLRSAAKTVRRRGAQTVWAATIAHD